MRASDRCEIGRDSPTMLFLAVFGKSVVRAPRYLAFCTADTLPSRRTRCAVCASMRASAGPHDEIARRVILH